MFLLFPAVSSGLTEDQKLIQGMALNFAQNEMFPHMAKWDQEEIFPIEVGYVKKFSIFIYIVKLKLKYLCNKKSNLSFCWFSLKRKGSTVDSDL